MSEKCKWIHEQLELLPLVTFPFSLKELPENGIYAFYEERETWGHGAEKLRIVRVGTHKNGNFRSRIREHFLLNEAAKMNFDVTKSPPHDRSIFRKNIGRAILNRDKDKYLDIWNIDFTTHKAREERGSLRDIKREEDIEHKVTETLRTKFAFRFLIVDDQLERMGTGGLESALIGTLSRCEVCRPSTGWLGNYSPVETIRSSGLWLVQHVGAKEVTVRDQEAILRAIAETNEWFKGRRI